jgi:hypothetical protein
MYACCSTWAAWQQRHCCRQRRRWTTPRRPEQPEGRPPAAATQHNLAWITETLMQPAPLTPVDRLDSSPPTWAQQHDSSTAAMISLQQHLLHLVVLGEVGAVVRQRKVGGRRRAPQPHLSQLVEWYQAIRLERDRCATPETAVVSRRVQKSSATMRGMSATSQLPGCHQLLVSFLPSSIATSLTGSQQHARCPARASWTCCTMSLTGLMPYNYTESASI